MASMISLLNDLPEDALSHLIIPISYLSNNKLKTLPDGIFNSLSNLTHP